MLVLSCYTQDGPPTNCRMAMQDCPENSPNAPCVQNNGSHGRSYYILHDRAVLYRPLHPIKLVSSGQCQKIFLYNRILIVLFT